MLNQVYAFGLFVGLFSSTLLTLPCPTALVKAQDDQRAQEDQPANASSRRKEVNSKVQPTNHKQVDDEIRLFMRAKLTSSQKLLEGLVVENYSKIENGAREMLLLSKGGNWPRTDDKVYNHYNTQFQLLCEKLEKLAKEENVDGVKFTYLQLTTSCVDCHNYVRKRFSVKRPANKKGPVQLIPTYWDDKKKAP